MPDAARAIAARRAGDVPGDADIIATACPTCASQLRPHAQKPVFEIATLVARALGLSG
jgi:Fe-S oxidoreductase